MGVVFIVFNYVKSFNSVVAQLVISVERNSRSQRQFFKNVYLLVGGHWYIWHILPPINLICHGVDVN